MPDISFQLAPPPPPPVRTFRLGDVFTLTLGPNAAARPEWMKRRPQPRQRTALGVVVQVGPETGRAMLQDSEGDLLDLYAPSYPCIHFLADGAEWMKRRRPPRETRQALAFRTYVEEALLRRVFDWYDGAAIEPKTAAEFRACKEANEKHPGWMEARDRARRKA